MAAAKSKSTTKSQDAVQKEFKKEQIIASDRYTDKQDLVNALLDDGKTYTFDMVDEQINKFLKGKVKN